MSKAASSNSAVNRMCKAVHPFLSQDLVRVLTEDAVDALTDDDKSLLGPHLCPHNQIQTLLADGYAIGAKAWKKHLHQGCRDEFSRRKVFACTCHFCASQKTPMSELTYQTVIIDEAGQVLEPDVIMLQHSFDLASEKRSELCMFVIAHASFACYSHHCL